MGNCCSGDAALSSDVSKTSLSLPSKTKCRTATPATSVAVVPPKAEANAGLYLAANGMLEKLKVASPPKAHARHSLPPQPDPPLQHAPKPVARHGTNAYMDELVTDTFQVSETTETGAWDCDPDDMTPTEIVDVSHPTHMHHVSDIDIISDMDFTSFDTKARAGGLDKERRFQNFEAEKRHAMGRRMDTARQHLFTRALKERLMHERSELLRTFFIERLSLFLQVVEADEFLRRQLILSEWMSSTELLHFVVPCEDSPSRTCDESQPPCRSGTVEGDLTSSNDEEETTTAQVRSSSISVRGLSRPQQAESVFSAS